jgi:chromosome partition protein MukB
MEEAKEKRERAREARDAVVRELEGKREERDRIGEHLRKGRQDHETARRDHERIAAANAIARRLAGLEEELSGVSRELEAADSALRRADEVRSLRSGERARAEETYRQAAEGLADLQRGLELAHRRAHAHRSVTLRLAEARAALGRPDLDADRVDEEEQWARSRIAAIDGKRHELDTAIATAAAHRADHREAMAALGLIVQRDVDPGEAHPAARSALGGLSEREHLASRAEALHEELSRARELRERQERVRAKAGELQCSRAVSEALGRSEAELRSAEERKYREERETSDLRRQLEERKAEERALEVRGARWRELHALASRLEASLGADLRTAEALEAARQRLDLDRDRIQGRLDELESARSEAAERARSLEETGGVFHGDLLAARDLVGGELLATHFDEVDPTEAGRVQARLGPLAEAIVVQDAREAAAALAGRERALDTIWLVEEGGLEDVAANGDVEAASGDVVVGENGVLRTTRVPKAPTLGRKARERRVQELRTEADEIGREIEGLRKELGEVASRRRDVALLTREVGTLSLGSPAADLERVASDLAEISRGIEKRVKASEEARKCASLHALRSETLRDLLPEAHLLDEPDLALEVSALEETLGAALRAKVELQRVSTPRRLLSERLDALRRSPLTDEEIESLRRELSDLGTQRSALFLAAEALAYVAGNREALLWTDAEEALSARQELVPALKAQCERADSERRGAASRAEAAGEEWERARAVFRGIDDRRSALEERRERERRDLDASGIADPSDAALERAAAAAERLSGLVEELDRSERKLSEEVAQLEERRKGREASLLEAEDLLGAAEREWKPAAELWDRLRARAEAAGLLSPSIVARLLEASEGSSVQLRTEARTKAALLEERLSSARGGKEILDPVRRWLSGKEVQEQTTGDDFLQVWEVVRDWLRRRVPAQVAEVDDPLEALERLRQRLKALGERLEEQERKLRGASEDVARGIDVHIRAATRQVRLLNRELQGVRFGTIRGISIHLSRDPRMEAVLGALREGTAQELLFAPTMPVEEALEALFTRFGGRGAILGQKLLDYREYVDLAVEIQRQGSALWERVNPSRLSTGEAIGVGTALMMVVLTAWERAANLFRAKRALGTLRLLFLDEANRLSQDNLEVLFELCAALDLQLLIAAPEVARAPGCTTYRLSRRETADGGEEVVVSGRRSVARA